MKEILKSLGNYQITSEDIAECNPWWGEGLLLVGLAGAVVGCIISYAYALSLDASPLYFGMDTFRFSTMGIGCLISCAVAFLLGIFLPTHYSKCGIIIKLIKLDKNSVSGWYLITCESFQFSNNQESDASKITDVVNKYTEKMNEFVEKERKDNFEKEQEKQKKIECCKQYRSVMEKVKKEKE